MAPLDELAVTSAGREVLIGNGRSQTVDTRPVPRRTTASRASTTQPDALELRQPEGSVKVAAHWVTATVTANSGGVLTVTVANPPASG